MTWREVLGAAAALAGTGILVWVAVAVARRVFAWLEHRLEQHEWNRRHADALNRERKRRKAAVDAYRR